VDVVIVRDVDRLTRNLTDWNAFEKAWVRHGVRLSAYTGGDLDLSTAEGAYYGGMETQRVRRESAVKSARVREAQDREARKGRRTGGGQRWFGYTRIYANPDEPNHKKRHILRVRRSHGPRVRLVQAARRQDHAHDRGDPGGAAKHQPAHYRAHAVYPEHREHGRKRGGGEVHQLFRRAIPAGLPVATAGTAIGRGYCRPAYRMGYRARLRRA